MNRHAQRGYLMVTVIMTLFLVATIAVLLTHESSMSANTTNRELETARAEYVARAGLQHALWRAQNNACMGDVTIPDTPLGDDSYNATISGAAAGSLVTVFADQDAWIRSDDPGRNNGSTPTSHVRSEGGNVEQVLTRFDVSSIPVNAQISSAIAWFHVELDKQHPEGPITIHEITADWAEAAVTWESFAGDYRSGTVGAIPAQETGDVWVAVNLTAQVQAWVNGYPNHGILFSSSDEGIHAQYTAREDVTNPPRLEVVVGSGQASPLTIRAKGKLVTGVLRNAKDKTALAYQPSTTSMLQPGPSRVDDAWITAGQTAWNYGAHASLRVQPNNQQTFIRFDLDGAVPRGALVTGATLELYAYDAINSGAIDLHRVTRSWAEGSCYGNCAADDGVTWDTYDGTNTWDTPGGDIEAAPAATASASGSNSWVAWDITDLAVDWVSGTAENHGVQILGNPGHALFHSSDALEPSLRPRLTIEYACECGSACLAPQGSGNLLMVVAEKTWLLDDDEALRSQFEAWGYAVTLISDHDNQNTFDGSFATHDAVFVSESVDPTKVGTKLNAATIGVVNAEGWLNEELGFESADSSNWPVGRSVDVSKSDHYITAPFAGGTLDIYDAHMGGLAVASAKAPGLQSLAEWSSGTGLATLDTGAMTAAGSAAPGRRVMLPFGREADVNWTKVNNNGFLLLQRSIEWAIGASAASGDKLLLVVGDASAPVQKDVDRRDLFESWGYAVTLIDDGADELKFKDEMLTTDVLYLTDSVSVSGFIPSLPALPTPIVSEPAANIDHLGLSDSSTTVSYNGFTATNAGHYIAAPFGGAGITLFTSNLVMPLTWGTLAPELQSAGEIGSATWALPTLDTGAERWDGTLSAQRRVHLPFGAADVSQMTEDGLTVLKRSIEWASGKGCNESTSLLFVVGDPAALTTDENARRDLLQSWCFGVALIDDDDTQANFDAAAGDAKVAYVSSEVSATAVGTKLRHAAVGVVSEDPDLHDEFGFSTVRFSGTTNAPLSTNAAHFITAPFAGADITLFTTDQPAGAAVGTLPSGLVSIGNWTSGDLSPLGGLLTLEMGAAKSGGGTAAGRRVQLPWQGQEGGAVADISALTADGESVLKRSLEWAAGEGCNSTTPLLFVVYEPGALSAEEIAKQNRVESWCFEVTVLDDDASQADFDAAIAINDVVYVSADAHENSVSTKLTGSPIGVVNEQARLNPDLGLATDHGSNGHDKVLLVDNAHEISTGFSTGWLTVTTVNQILYSLEGTLAPGLQNLAEVWISGANYKYGLAVLETGGELWAGGSAAGRRVALPWGQGSGFNTLNANGLTLTRRALEWAADDGKPIAHWKLDETSGTTAVDSEGGHDGTLANGPTWTTGQVGGGLDFDGVDDEVSVGAPAALDNVFSGGGTVSAWIYPRDFGAEGGRIVDKWRTDTNGVRYGWLFTLYAAENTLLVGRAFSGQFGYWHAPADSIQLDTWQHVAAVYDDSSDVNKPKLYIDGAPQALTEWFTPSGTPMSDAGGVLTIGDRSDLGTTRTFDGIVDDVRIYDRMLSPTDVEDLAVSGGSPPVAHWMLDEASGTVALDSAGKHDGTLANGPAWTSGQIGGALRFDGSNDRINVPHQPSLNFVATMTLSAWVNADTLKPFQMVLTKGDNGVYENYWLGTEGGKANFGFVAGGTYYQHTTTGLTLGAGQWHHIAATYDDAANEVKIYVDGVAETFSTPGTPVINSEQLIIGNSYYSGEGFDGIIDDVRIYNGVLSAVEIADIARGGGGSGGGGGPAEYLDNFDSVAYTGSDGTMDWSGDPWKELTEYDGPASGKLFVAADPVVPEPGSQRLVVDSRLTNLSRPVDLSGFSSAYLSFTYRRDGYPTPNDYFSVLVSDNGSTWVELDRIYGIANDPVYRAAVYDISAYATASTEIQIATGGINNMQTLYVDNVRVASTLPGGCAGVFADEFNVRSYANNDGTLNWSGDWTEIKEDDGPTSGDIQIRNEINNYQLRVRDDGYGLWRSVNLSGASQATLSLDYKRLKLDSSSDYVTVDVSADGGSTWTELDRFAGPGDDNLYQYRYYDITAHAGPNTQIRFLGSPSLGGQDEVWFDDIEVVCTP